MKSKLSVFFISLLFGLSFLLFSLVVKKDKFINLDFDATVKIQDRIPKSFDTIFTKLSFLASFEIVSLLLFFILLFLFFKKNFLSPIVILFYIFGHMVEIYGKVLLDHPSPPMKFVREFDTTIFPVWYSHPVSSYPSGHSLRITFLSIILVFILFKTRLAIKVKRFFAICLVFLVITTLFARVALGTHWASDVIGGLLLGGNLGFMSLLVL